ncbi:MAG TPA: hypothetical protein VGN57_17745 [Pirellulaceae bacterium]|jgi:hypothetical protein|nr:hypothetical protein [Pirellulaceae bacterium]
MSSPSRFSLRGLLIGLAILSVSLAGGTYFVNGVFFALEAENNLVAFSRTAEALTAFVERHRRWPRDEAELRQFEGQPAYWQEARDEALVS